MARTQALGIQRLARVSLLAAVALVLSYLETMIPLPVALPGIKLGLANIAVVVALFSIDMKSAAAVAAVKVLASGFLFGSPMMLAYSAGGMVLAFAGMALASLVPGIGLVPVSMLAAVLHNAGQLGVAALVLGTPSVFINLPVLAVAACITGGITGAVGEAALESLLVGDGEGERALVDLSGFTIAPGEHVAFIGANGSGKSTAALRIAGLLGCEGGDKETGVSVAFAEVQELALGGDADDAGDAARTAEAAGASSACGIASSACGIASSACGIAAGAFDCAVGLAFQDPDSQIVAPVVRDDCAFGLENRGVSREQMEALVDAALVQAGAESLRLRSVAQLSGGQKQRVAIAGLLAMAPGVMIFDETTAMLDAPAREAFANLVKELCGQGIAVIQITQLMDEAFAADRIVLFSEGAIRAIATPAEFLQQPELLAACGLELPCR